MPITSFRGFDDGLQSAQRQRDHFIAVTDPRDDDLWIPYADGVWFQPCHFNVTSGGQSVLLKALPGAMLGTHYHVGPVYGYTLEGKWRYLEHDWVATPGTFIYEPAGEAHTLVATDDSPGPMVTFFVVSGGLIYIDEEGRCIGYDDGFTLLETARRHYRESGRDASVLDALIR